MKKIILFTAFALCAQLLAAQQPVKKYALIEHFTNSVCPSCASRNPALFTLIEQPQNASEVHHISIHPQFPYASCVFYQANKVENNARATYYNVSGTPSLAINGSYIGGGNPLLSQAKLNTYLNQTSPAYVRVYPETGSGSQKNVKIEVRTVGTVPANYKLHVILVEKTINLQTPNGEPVHHNVLRDIITDPAGADYTPAPLGQSVEYNFTYTPNAAWNANELYILAFLQNDAKEVLNSGTKFDPVTSGTRDAVVQNLIIQPNPAHDFAFAQVGNDDVVQQVEMFSVNGQRTVLAFQEQQGQIELPLSGLAPGIYIVKMTGAKGVYVGKLVKN